MILLLRRSLQKAEPHLHLLGVLALRPGPHVPRAGDVCRLLRAQVKKEGALLYFLIVLRNERGWFEEISDYVEEG